MASRGSSRERKVVLKLGGRDGLETVVDAEDFEWLSQWNWHALKAGRFRYAARTEKRGGKQQTFLLHRVVLGLRHGDERQGDHINGDTLDNRRTNLRIVTLAQNRQNILRRGGTSRHRGVSWSTRDKRWIARLMVDRKVYLLGNYKDEDEAGRVVAEARVRLCPFAVEERA